jgi:formylglycine-generating enzyme required for sulfatase activity
MARAAIVVVVGVLTFGCGGGSSGDEATSTGDGDGDGDADADGTEGFEMGGCASICGTPGCGECPTSSSVDAGGVMIDAVEVGIGAYAAFLAVDFDTAVLPAGCEWKQGFLPEDWDPSLDPAIPVTGIDWCDAMVYCTWAGQQLCGDVDGGPASWDDSKDFTGDAWLLACSNGGERMYPYGNEFDASACNGEDAGNDALVPGGSLASCEGGVPGLFDMSGNTWEWTNACEVEGGDADTSCRRRGGSRHSSADSLRCEIDSGRSRSSRDNGIGFRCCG